MAKADGKDLESRLTGVSEKPKTLSDFVYGMRGEIEKALPKHINADRILRIALTALRTNSKLQSCNPQSFMAALMMASQCGLEPNTPLGEAFIIPYKGEASFQLGYKGIITLAYRTGEYRTIYAMEVYQNDEFKYSYGLDPTLVHVPADDPQGEPTHYYAVYHLTNGGREFRVWTRQKIDAHARKFSAALKANADTPWKTDFDSMAKKTVLKDLLRYAPKSIELARQLSLDETVRQDLAEDMSETMAIDLDTIDIAVEEAAATTEPAPVTPEPPKPEPPKVKPKEQEQEPPAGGDVPQMSMFD